MKRHDSFVPLSHDHHAGLVLAHRLKRGAAKAPRSDWPSDLVGQRNRTVEFYQNELIPHFRAEEEVVFPLAEGRLSDPKLLSLLRGQHQLASEMADLLTRCGEPDLGPALSAFGDLLERHIRAEERILFEELQQALDETELARCGQSIRDVRSRVES